MTLFLIGYMASGKTTLGRALGRATGYQFIDLDFYITQRYRKSIPEIFAETGEEEFRRIESEMLREVGEFCDVIISCGGGTPCFHSNMEFMNSHGVTLLLDASTECTIRRLKEAKTRRPILEKVAEEELPAFIESHKLEREPFYSQAQLRMDSEQLESAEQIKSTVDRVCKMLRMRE